MKTDDRRELLFVWPYAEWGGMQIYFAGIMKRAADGYAVRAVMPQESDEKIRGYMAKIGVECEFFPARMDLSTARSAWDKVRRRLRDARCAVAIARHLRRRDLARTVLHLDVVPWSWAWFGLLVYLSLRGNVFLTLHIGIPDIPTASRLVRRLQFAILCRLRGFHLLVANRDMGNSLKAFLPARSRAAIPLARSGVDRAEIDRILAAPGDRRELRKRHGLPDDRLLVFTLAQVIRRKGIFVLLDAVARIKAMGLPVFFVWIGKGDQAEEAEAIIREGGLADIFRIVPPARIGPDRVDLLGFLDLADLFVLPAFAEGLPSALLEAMAIGKACIASAVNGIPEAIRDGETGILVPPGDRDALVESIARLARDPGLRERLGAAAQSFILKEFDERRAAEITLDYYRACVGET